MADPLSLSVPRDWFLPWTVWGGVGAGYLSCPLTSDWVMRFALARRMRRCDRVWVLALAYRDVAGSAFPLAFPP